ncbi:hypothetical protein GCM10007028_11790 [Algibacter mikhailovii]|uniref:Carrier domain-containing protein n=2 Tax=Algibacter mikhailovii TaxID=425498 RepID=A0A918QVZ1_9FLAO|nr:hypothetical protein GCM10007028_11790 [Algibacter mikhailovii]
MDVLFLRKLANRRITMKKEALIAQLKDIVQPYVQNEEALENLTENTDFISDLKINSANLVDVVLDVEEVFDIEIDNDAMEKMLTVKAAMEIISAKLDEK